MVAENCISVLLSVLWPVLTTYPRRIYVGSSNISLSSFLFVTRFNQAIERVVVSDDNRRVEKWIRWAELQYTSPFKVEYECNDTLPPNHQALKFRFNTARIPLRLHGILLRPEILLYKDGSCPTLFLSFGYKNKTEVIQPSIPTGTICLLFNCPTSVSEHWQEESGKPHHLLLDAHRLR